MITKSIKTKLAGEQSVEVVGTLSAMAVTVAAQDTLSPKGGGVGARWGTRNCWQEPPHQENQAFNHIPGRRAGWGSPPPHGQPLFGDAPAGAGRARDG